MIDVVVIGAGLSGLVCARRLAAGGARVVVLEGRDRVGGRLHTGELAGGAIDLGGQWLSAGQPRLAALAGELGVATFPQPRDGRAVLADEPAGRLARFGAAWATWRAVRRIARLRPDDRDDRLDAWFARTIAHPTARARLALHAELVFAAPPSEVTVRAYLARLAVTGGLSPTNGTGEHRFIGGAQALALRLAETLDVRLAHAVRAIDGGAVRFDGGSVSADRVVLAVPPPLARAIAADYPPAIRAYLDGARAGGIVKCFAAYDRAFWRDAGLSGELYAPGGVVRGAVDASPPDGPPTLLAFAFQAGRDRVVAELARRFGAATPIAYVEYDWSTDAWSGGCVPLAVDAAWRAPFGRVHVAGTETAAQWPGYMEGAIEAGERAAAEILIRER